MKVLVTGASGFIGSSYIKSNSEHQIYGICLLTNPLSSFSFKNADVIIHLAALVHQMKGAPDADYYRVNTDLAYETALKAKKEGVKHFIFMSTIKVYGESTTGKGPFNENSECSPQDSYGKSKLEAEKKLLSLCDEKFKVAIIRSPLVYGPGVKANMYNLVRLIDKSLILPFGNISNKRSFVYIDNLIALIDKIIGSQASGLFLAGDPYNLSTTELVITISRALNKKRLLFSPPYFFKKIISALFPSQYDRLWGSLEVDPASGWTRIGFTSPVLTDTGIVEMVKWYKDNRNVKDN